MKTLNHACSHFGPIIYVSKTRNQALRNKSPYWELFWSAFFPDFPAFGLNTEWMTLQ